jgi:hypothetical protein
MFENRVEETAHHKILSSTASKNAKSDKIIPNQWPSNRYGVAENHDGCLK